MYFYVILKAQKSISSENIFEAGSLLRVQNDISLSYAHFRNIVNLM